MKTIKKIATVIFNLVMVYSAIMGIAATFQTVVEFLVCKIADIPMVRNAKTGEAADDVIPARQLIAERLGANFQGQMEVYLVTIPDFIFHIVKKVVEKIEKLMATARRKFVEVETEEA